MYKHRGSTDQCIQVVLNARSEDKLKGVADEIKAAGGDVAMAPGDVSKVNNTIEHRA